MPGAVWTGFENSQRDRYTLRFVLEKGVYIVFECCKCRKVATVDAIALVDLYGSETTLGEIRGKARCRRCGSGEAEVLLRRDTPYREFKWWPRPPIRGR